MKSVERIKKRIGVVKVYMTKKRKDRKKDQEKSGKQKMNREGR